MSLRVVVLLSGAGTLCQAVLDARSTGLDVVVAAVGSDRPDAPGLERARAAGVPTFVVALPAFARRGSPERRDWDQRLAAAVAEHRPDLVVLAGFMKLLDEPFLAAFGGRIINSHPSLLPAFPGAHAVADALAAGVSETGCTIFWVDAGVDTGAPLAQARVAIEPGDDEPTLHERIKTVERALLVDTLATLAADPRRNHER